MGLDMYLYKRTYIGNKWKKPEEQIKIEVAGVKQERVSEIIEEVGYWRKANAIHQWFVENCGEGEDNCQDIYVPEEDLTKLLETVNKVLTSSKLILGKVHNGTTYTNGKTIENIEDGKVIEDTKVAEELLPTQSGFFFGGTDYDEYYWNDLVETKKILENALKEKGADFYYRASW